MDELVEKKELRNFGLIVGSVFFVIGIWPMIRHGEALRLWAFVPAAPLMLLGLVAPNTLGPLFKVWMKVLIELATGSKLEIASPKFPVVLCPNTNILMLKFMNMLASGGKLFKGYHIEVTESHQAEKRSAPGTAIAIAQSLGLCANDVVSVRDTEKQLTTLSIPAEHLGRHAVHAIFIEDAVCRISLETRVYGASPYADGVSKIVSAVTSRQLENRVYAIDEFIEHGWV